MAAIITAMFDADDKSENEKLAAIEIKTWDGEIIRRQKVQHYFTAIDEELSKGERSLLILNEKWLPLQKIEFESLCRWSMELFGIDLSSCLVLGTNEILAKPPVGEFGKKRTETLLIILATVTQALAESNASLMRHGKPNLDAIGRFLRERIEDEIEDDAPSGLGHESISDYLKEAIRLKKAIL